MIQSQKAFQCQSKRRQLWGILLRFGVSVTLLVFLLNQLNFSQIRSVVNCGRLDLLIVMCVSMFAERVYAAYRWYVLLGSRDVRVPFRVVLRMTFASCFFGMFLPGGGIEALRVVGMGKSQEDYAMSVSSVMAERFIGLLTLAGMVVVGVAMMPGKANGSIAICAMSSLIILLITCVATYHAKTRATCLWICQRLHLVAVGEWLSRLYQHLDRLRGAPGIVLWSIVLAVGLQLLRVFTVVVGAMALNIRLPLITYFAYVPIVLFAQMLPISVAGIGVRESMFVYFFGKSGVAAEEAFMLGMLVYLTTLISSLPGAWVGTSAFGQESPPKSLKTAVPTPVEKTM